MTLKEANQLLMQAMLEVSEKAADDETAHAAITNLASAADDPEALEKLFGEKIEGGEPSKSPDKKKGPQSKLPMK